MHRASVWEQINMGRYFPSGVIGMPPGLFALYFAFSRTVTETVLDSFREGGREGVDAPYQPATRGAAPLARSTTTRCAPTLL